MSEFVSLYDLHASERVLDASTSPEDCGITEEAMLSFIGECKALTRPDMTTPLHGATWGIALGIQAERNRARRTGRRDV